MAKHLHELFLRGLRHFPGRACLVDAEGPRTYAEVADASGRIANALRRAGLGPGDRVGVLSPNAAPAFDCLLGLLRAGCSWVPLNPRNPVAELEAYLVLTRCAWIFYHEEFEETAAALRASLPGLRGIVRFGGTGAELAAWAGAEAAEVEPLQAGWDHEATAFPTGGTTGRSKAVRWTSATWAALAANLHAGVHHAEPPVFLVAAPMTHAAGVVALAMLGLGATCVMIPRAEPLAVMEAIERHRVTTLFLPPTVIYMMLAHGRVRDFDYSSLRQFVYAAAPMSVEKLREAMAVFGPVMCQTYGQAEAPMVCTVLSREDHAEALRTGLTGRLASCGRPTLFTDLAVMDEAGALLGPRAVGEIVVRGPLVMAGYLDDPAATEAASAHGWHHTGDLGFQDEDGFVYIVDRKRDMIISGGFNVYPGEIEQVLCSHPAVQDCAVVGVPDDKWGEAVKAVVELKPGRSVDPEELVRHCRERLDGVRTPKSVEIWPELPRSPVGKVLKRTIRDRFWAGRDRKI
ncbi:MAG TPA: AMP-binding protein [Azospirillaceae bacterium]|nr:AMP-binding protein [Azospirillaceae bacterium]